MVPNQSPQSKKEPKWRILKEIVDKLAELYQVPVDDLLDDYNRFLLPRARKIDTGISRESWLAEKAFRKTHRG